MTKTSKAFLLAVLLGISAAQPLASASAAAPNAVTNQTVDNSRGSTGVYDNYDQFKDPSGRPLQGYGYLWAVPGD